MNLPKAEVVTMFSSYYKKALCALLCLLTLSPLFSLNAAASIKPNYSTYEYGDAYKTSVYYERLLEARAGLTGDHRYDVILVALSQIGYHEGDSDADMDGWNLGGSNNYVEYNRLFTKLEGNWGYAWCAAFVSWCQFQAGVPAEIDCSEISCPRMINEILKPQELYVTRESGYERYLERSFDARRTRHRRPRRLRLHRRRQRRRPRRTAQIRPRRQLHSRIRCTQRRNEGRHRLLGLLARGRPCEAGQIHRHRRVAQRPRGRGHVLLGHRNAEAGRRGRGTEIQRKLGKDRLWRQRGLDLGILSALERFKRLHYIL